MQLGIHNYAEIAAAVICTVCLVRKPSVLNRWFTPFLWLTVIIELTAKVLTAKNLLYEKVLMYNIFNGVEFIFYLWFFFRINHNPGNKRFLFLMMLVFFGFFVFNLLFTQGLWQYNNQTTTVGAILIITTCLYEYYNMHSREDTDGSSKWAIVFVASGLLVFYAGNFPNNALLNEMIKTDATAARMLYATINNNLNVALYSLFSLGFISELLSARQKSEKPRVS